MDDPSLSYSNDNPVRNMAGAGGAVVADLAMQVFGLAAVLVPLVLAIRGILCLVGRRAGRAGQRAWIALGGLALASAALGSLQAPAGWPLPIGLGGIVGDLLLKIPALATGAYPSGAWSWVAAALFAAPALWCTLNGAGLVGASAEPVALSGRRARRPPTRTRARAASRSSSARRATGPTACARPPRASRRPCPSSGAARTRSPTATGMPTCR